MDRKDFISLTVPAFTIIKSIGKNENTHSRHGHQPPYLVQGDTIGITCPSGFITLEEVQPAIIKLKEWGFNVIVGKTVGLKDFTLAGTDLERATDTQQMLDDPQIKAILLGRGGYGAVRMIDLLDFSKFKKHPKWIIGFSDATVFHSHINSKFGISSIHSKMCNSFPADVSKAAPEQLLSIESINSSLRGDKIIYPIVYNSNNRQGEGTGKLIGGNLSIIQNMNASTSALKTAGRILFLEDVGEYLYSLDRMMWNLLRSGQLNNLAGLIIGRFSIKDDLPGEEFGKTIYEIVNEKIKNFRYPVLFDFPVGHVKENYALKCGVEHRLTITSNSAELIEI